MSKCQPLVLAALPAALAAAVAQRRPLSVCDFGAADGGTSLPMWHSFVSAARRSHPDVEISMAFEDQPNNDWKSLFAYMGGRLRVPDAFAGASGRRSFVEDFPGVYVAAIGTSFHVQCLPSGTLHLGFSSTAMHWLSAAPMTLPSAALHHTQLPASDPAAAAFAQQAAKDWERILLARAAELAPGGRLVIANFCVDEQGQSLGRTHSCPAKMFDEMLANWASMVEDGKISQAEFDATTFISYYRTPEELTAPLLDPTSAVHAAGLRLASCSTIVTPCPFRAAWLAGTAGGDAAAHADAFVLTTRTWSNSTFEAALSPERPAAEKRLLVDELFTRYAAAVAAAPGDHGMDYVHAVMVIEKVAA